MNKNTMIKVLNRDNGAIVYSLPEMNNLKRVFQAGQVKEVSFQELQQLSYIPGGMELLRDFLVIQNSDEAIKELLGHVEPEYSYSKQDIIKLMKTGSLDEFLDCLDFAPDGVKDLIKNLSVELPLNDVAKRDAIYEKLGFNVSNAIRIQQEAAAPDKVEENTQRRVKKPQDKKASTGRRVVVEKK